jgi:ABC-type molybdate transport system ATPase subunit
VAINMQPDILLADEILAVGDIAFQERCLERVADEAAKGLTVLFVSHDMSAITRLCKEAAWLDHGQLMKLGPAPEVVAEYERAALGGTRFTRGEPGKGGHANLHCEIAGVRLMNPRGEGIGAVNIAEGATVRIRLRVRKAGVSVRGIVDAHVKNVFAFRTVQPDPIVSEDKGIFDLFVTIPADFLSETSYTLTVTVYSEQEKQLKAVLPGAMTFLAYGSKDAGLYKNALIAPRLDWSVKKYLHVTGQTERKLRKAARQR